MSDLLGLSTSGVSLLLTSLRTFAKRAAILASPGNCARSAQEGRGAKEERAVISDALVRERVDAYVHQDAAYKRIADQTSVQDAREESWWISKELGGGWIAQAAKGAAAAGQTGARIRAVRRQVSMGQGIDCP